MQFDDPNSPPKMNDQTPLTDAVGASLVPFVLATPHHAPAEVVHQADSSQNSSQLTEAQLEAIGVSLCAERNRCWSAFLPHSQWQEARRCVNNSLLQEINNLSS